VRGNVPARFGEGDTPYPQGSTVPTLPMVRPCGLFNMRCGYGPWRTRSSIRWKWRWQRRVKQP